MSAADADKIDKEVTARETNSKDQQDAIDKETDAAKKAQKTKEKEDYDAITEGMRKASAALRKNPTARPGAVIPRLRDVEALDVKKLEGARDEANRNHDAARVKQLDRSIELANKTIEGKGKAHDLLALGPGPVEKEGKFAMKLSIEDDAGREVVRLAINLFSSLEDAIVLEDESPRPGVDEGTPQARPGKA
jgi:hypothetical protein